jgi:glucose/arabinose dehydrogenase
MPRRLILAALLIGTACSAQPQQAGIGNERPGGAKAAVDAMTGPQGPQPAGSNNPVPKDSPDYNVADVAATTGRANIPATPPPFAITTIGQFAAPFSMAFLPDGSLLVTEKGGQLKLRHADGSVKDLFGVPKVAQGGQGGLLDIAPAPDFNASNAIYLTYAEPRPNGGSSLALARATLVRENRACDRPPCPAQPVDHLADVRILWRAGSDGPGGQFGAIIAFAPDGKSLFLSSGERQRFAPAQDPQQALGKILHLTLDGKPAPGNPFYPEGAVKAATWSTGHRNPYGLVFTPDGRLWEEEMGPRGGDELNLILPGRNYGWPIVSNGDNYSGKAIPDHPSRPDLEAPKLWWNPVISPGGMIVYSGAMFPEYKGNLFIAGLSSKALMRVKLDGAAATPGDQWAMGTRIRDVAQAPDGAIWLLEDGEHGAGGRLIRLTRKG